LQAFGFSSACRCSEILFRELTIAIQHPPMLQTYSHAFNLFTKKQKKHLRLYVFFFINLQQQFMGAANDVRE